MTIHYVVDTLAASNILSEDTIILRRASDYKLHVVQSRDISHHLVSVTWLVGTIRNLARLLGLQATELLGSDVVVLACKVTRTADKFRDADSHVMLKRHVLLTICGAV